MLAGKCFHERRGRRRSWGNEGSKWDRVIWRGARCLEGGESEEEGIGNTPRMIVMLRSLQK